MATAKDELKTLLEQQPEDSSSEELVRELAFKEDSVKVTISLSKSSVDFFKREAKKHDTKYQQMIRRLLDAYTRAQDRHITNR